MENKAKNILLTTLALLVYLGFFIGIGFIWNLFWTMDKPTTIIYWVTKGICCLFVVIFALYMLLAKSDKGVGAMQLFFSLLLSCLPIVLRAICLIPAAGLYIAIVLAFILISLYAITMISLCAYGNGEGNKKL